MSKIRTLYSSDWDDIKVAKWANIRRKGKWHYVVTRFVLLWGGAMAAALSAWTIYISPSPIYLPRVFVVNFIIWPIFGLFLGISGWRSNEKKYNEYNSNPIAPNNRVNLGAKR